ncbi:MAG TPA: IS1634 family transposase [Pseudolabrys sp.]|jgi:transposase|nr:IS1634 family transposase [Pseudolabrys sp.]
MYIRKSIRTYKGKTYTNYVLVESIVTPNGPRQKTICWLGDLSPRPRQQWLELALKIEDALVGQDNLVGSDDNEVAEIVSRVRARRTKEAHPQAEPSASLPRTRGGALIKVDPSRVTTEQHREAGPVHVGHQFWQRLGLDQILRDCGLSAAVCRLACVMTLNRLIAPASEHAMPAWIRRTALADILGVSFDALEEDPLYQVLDKLYPHRTAIEAALIERERSLFNLDQTIYLYDLTSTYFEGLCAGNPKAQRGHSRDKRSDCKQLVVGLVVNRDGFPLAHEIFAGNTRDHRTLGTMIDRLGERVELKEGATVVVDRGMAFDDNLADIKARKLHYIVASRQPERNRWLAEFEDTDGFMPVLREPSPLNPAQKKTTIEVKVCADTDDETYVLCRSEQRIAKDRAIRAKHEQKLLADIEKLAQRVAKGQLVKPEKINQAIGRLRERYPRVARYHPLSYDEKTATLVSTLDADKHRTAEKLDGCYLLKTDRKDLTSDEIWRIYTLLTRAEDAFRDMKSPLVVRPIFHQKEHRSDAHIFVSLLAYHLLTAIEKTLLDQGIHTSWASVRDTLKTHQVCTVVLPTDDGSCLRIRKAATPESDVQQIYRNLAIPPQVIAPKRTWTQSAHSD